MVWFLLGSVSTNHVRLCVSLRLVEPWPDVRFLVRNRRIVLDVSLQDNDIHLAVLHPIEEDRDNATVREGGDGGGEERGKKIGKQGGERRDKLHALVSCTDAFMYRPTDTVTCTQSVDKICTFTHQTEANM